MTAIHHDACTHILAAFAVGYFVGLRQPEDYRSLVRVGTALTDVWLAAYLLVMMRLRVLAPNPTTGAMTA
ncbi:MAG TPA: hypothetical protein VEY12_11685 [Thermoplasmata archaeon]|nr:hypothetical protein [Thermoplasmata archaeon]